MFSYLPAVVDASWAPESAVAEVPDAGTVVVRAAGLRVHGGTATPAGAVPALGELAVFCRPMVTAPALPRRRCRGGTAACARTEAAETCTLITTLLDYQVPLGHTGPVNFRTA